jgi:chromosome segregation ATPase
MVSDPAIRELREKLAETEAERDALETDAVRLDEALVLAAEDAERAQQECDRYRDALQRIAGLYVTRDTAVRIALGALAPGVDGE